MGFLVAVGWVLGVLPAGVGLSLLWEWSISVCPVQAALTFFAAAKKVSKESGLTPLILKRVPRTATVVAHLESESSHLPRS